MSGGACRRQANPETLPAVPGLCLNEVCAPTSLEAWQTLFTDFEQCALNAGVTLRQPPAEPTTCCGRGCNGCVWEGFYSAAAYWREEAMLQLQGLL